MIVNLGDKMANKKLKELDVYALKEGKYLAVGPPIVIRTISEDIISGSNIGEPGTKFYESLEKLIGSVSIPRNAEFFVKGCTRFSSTNYRLTPVQFYKTVKINVSIS